MKKAMSRRGFLKLVAAAAIAALPRLAGNGNMALAAVAV